MTIKAIKENYNGRYGKEKHLFAVAKWDNEKYVIVVTDCRHYRKTVWQAVRVSDGKEMIPDGDCRPCDNMDDAIDVAAEMMVED